MMRSRVCHSSSVIRHSPFAGRRSSFAIRHSSFAISCVCFLALLTTALGQSYFNMRGLGQISPPADARIIGLGAPAALSYLNPGILVHLPKASFTGTTEAAGTLGSESGQNRFFGTVRPAGFHSAIPLPLNSRLLLGIDQRFNQDFDVWSESLPDTAYRYHVVGRGGIYALRAGLAKSLFGIASIGIEYNRLIGGSREDWKFELSEGHYVSTDTVELNYSGDALRIGASVQTNLFTLAAHYQPTIKLTAQSSRRVHGVIEDSINTYRLALPNAVALGASVKPLERLIFAAGLDYRPWSGLTVNDTAFQGNRDALRLCIGSRYLLGSIPLRLGFSYQPWYYSAAGNQAIIEHRLHLGTSIPIPKFGSLDIAAQISRRSAGQLTETAGSLVLSLAYHEAWLKRTRRWGY